MPKGEKEAYGPQWAKAKKLCRLCTYGECPKGKPDCLVEGCGEVPFLQRHEGFRLRPDALRPGKTVVLYEAPPATTRDDEEVPF
ncbi:MAG: hypothetical protein FJ291_13050 [Planctomycetes bacterium]|nr:hypothetical protein [Planctomycetota bacterium]